MTKSSWERIDEEIEEGLVTVETIQHFRDAENYGTAPPMEWLVHRLKTLRKLIENGRPVNIGDGESFRCITTVAEFEKWQINTLPTFCA